MTGAGGRGAAGVALAVNRAPAPEPGSSEVPFIQLLNPVKPETMRDYAYRNRRIFDEPEMVQADLYHGQVLALCAAGPSLADPIYPADQVWGCNSAVMEMAGRGLTAGIGIDQTDGMLRDWADPPDVPYMVASTCPPELVEHLVSKGRRVVFFHNLVGWGEGEIDHYNEDWPPGYMIGLSGATIVSRVLGMVAWMGFRRIDIYGADCSFGPNDVAHVNGETVSEAYGSPIIMEGDIGGRTWRVRPDMLMCAVDLVRRVRESEGRIRLMGDTLPVALLGYDDEVLDSVMSRHPQPRLLDNDDPHGDDNG